MNQITAVSSDGTTLTFANAAPGASSIKVGDVIVSDVTPTTPNGMLRKVTGKTAGPEGVVVTTAAATLEQSVEKANISVSGTLSSSNLVGVQARQKGVSFKRMANSLPPVLQINNVVLYDADGNASTSNDEVVANGSVSLNPSFNFNLDIDNFTIKSASFTNTMVETAQITLSSTVQHAIGKEVELGSYQFAPITVWAGYVPVVITPVLKVVVGATGQVSVGLTSSVTQEASLTAGLRYENGAWSPTKERNNSFDFSPPTLSANASAKAYAGPQLELMLYGVVGPYANIKGFLELDADVASTPWWTLYGGLSADVGMKMNVLGHTLADHSETVLDVRQVLGQAAVATTLGALNAVVKDAVTGSGLSGVAVTATRNGTLVASATSNSSGVATIQLPAGEGYDFAFTKTGYLSTGYRNVTVTADTTNYLATVLQIDSNHSGPGNASGTVVNAFTGQGIAGLSIVLRPGINNVSGTATVSGSTNSAGFYSFTGVPAGNYTAEVSGSGFTTTHFTVTSIGGVTLANQNYSLTPILPAGQTRIVLTWGATPSDLDSHLTGPDGAARFHIYFGDKSYYSGAGVAADLDLDDTTSYGPETTTIYQQSAGTYRFSVHDFTNGGALNSTALANSTATVTVYRGSSVIAIFNVPTGVGNLWTVFELNGDTVIPVNTLTNVAGSDAVLKPVIGGLPARTDATLLRNLPRK
ncbi:carboxypeptidase regulatory-like domain-containing protein [Geomonas subterranea]|uniref:carboxypeptidase regulatory-like domain-containing protein n=1 Tax=Geomonas subterranea TaxID=2847989 RepID=UPI001CD2A8CE|nr:carboxypeptidase regulatory-like domain-containing protein [Geomonas fuzhouensis]